MSSTVDNIANPCFGGRPTKYLLTSCSQAGGSQRFGVHPHQARRGPGGAGIGQGGYLAKAIHGDKSKTPARKTWGNSRTASRRAGGYSIAARGIDITGLST